MSDAQWERRFACALGMAIYIHMTAAIWGGLWPIMIIAFCMIYASMPAMAPKSAPQSAAQEKK